MSLAPEPYLSACLAVVRAAIIDSRNIAYSASRGDIPQERGKQLADVLDAVENIPDLIRRWEDCDEPRIRAFLVTYDEKWKGKMGMARLLTPIYDQLVKPDAV